MKRTLTAAAVLAGSAGALGFAGTANAAEARAIPAELPVNSNVADTAYHLAGTVDSATRVVGDVVPAEKESNTQAGEDGLPAATVMDMSSGDVLGGLVGSKQPVGAQQEPRGARTQDRSGDALLPGGGPSGNGLSSVVDGVTGAVPSLVGQTLPAKPLPAKSDARTGLTDGTLLEGVLPPVTAEPHAVTDQLGKTVGGGALGGLAKLSGN